MKQRGNQSRFPVGQSLPGNFDQILGNVLLHLVNRIFIKSYLVSESMVIGNNTFLRFFQHLPTYIQHRSHFLNNRFDRQIGCWKQICIEMFRFLLFIICSGYHFVQKLNEERHKRQKDQGINYIEYSVSVGNLSCQITGGHGNILQIERDKRQHDQGPCYVKQGMTKGKPFAGQIASNTGDTRRNTCADINPENQVNRRRKIQQPGGRECYDHSGGCTAALQHSRHNHPRQYPEKRTGAETYKNVSYCLIISQWFDCRAHHCKPEE